MAYDPLEHARLVAEIDRWRERLTHVLDVMTKASGSGDGFARALHDVALARDSLTRAERAFERWRRQNEADGKAQT